MPPNPRCSDRSTGRNLLVVATILLVIVYVRAYNRIAWVIPFTIFWVFTLVFCCVVHIDTTVGTGPPAANQNSNTVPVAAAALHQAPNEVGLAPTAIRALPTFVHKKAPSQSGESSDRGAEMCSVCLEVIQEGETVRQLPVCLHLFHMGCVDMWLGSHSTCPVCRSAIVLLDCA
ncbi:RING-H2 finger protein ATL1-like [Ananas comosus]|uniref:RING-type E3 ubiquitin transferase n=1 Tax=Ananas comosus TaxID=4615 RepID=A0A6P5EWV1_ANACO|nr:RING-H2 finger protein ATL1-like [Ananas comosus]